MDNLTGGTISSMLLNERSRCVHDSALYKCTFTYLLIYLLTPMTKLWDVICHMGSHQRSDGGRGTCAWAPFEGVKNVLIFNIIRFVNMPPDDTVLPAARHT